jgi:hypothetical protein
MTKIIAWIRYIDHIHTLSENIKFIYTSFRNVKKSEHYASFSDLFHSDWKLIIYFPIIYIYIVSIMLCQKPQNNCQIVFIHRPVNYFFYPAPVLFEHSHLPDIFFLYLITDQDIVFWYLIHVELR